MDALNDDRIGRRDFRQGLRHGGTDREARRIGRQLGSAAAVDLAAVDAENDVAIQFRDLENEPVFAAVRGIPVWVAPPVTFDLPGVSGVSFRVPQGIRRSLRRVVRPLVHQCGSRDWRRALARRQR